MDREKLKSRRLELGYTLQDVADKMNLTRATIQKYESGLIKGVETTTLEKLAKVLQTTPAYLMGWEDSDNKSDNNESELEEYLEELRTRPEMKMLFNLTKNATKEDVEKAVKIIEMMLEK